MATQTCLVTTCPKTWPKQTKYCKLRSKPRDNTVLDHNPHGEHDGEVRNCTSHRLHTRKPQTLAFRVSKPYRRVYQKRSTHNTKIKPTTPTPYTDVLAYHTPFQAVGTHLPSFFVPPQYSPQLPAKPYFQTLISPPKTQ